MVLFLLDRMHVKCVCLGSLEHRNQELDSMFF